jgi:enoyl-CoA hydratase
MQSHHSPGGPSLSEKHIAIDDRDGVAIVAMNRPPANAIHLTFLEQLDQALVAIGERSPRAMVLTGHGEIFCAGLDLKAVPRYDRAQQNLMLARLNELIRRLYAMPIPTVAAVNGHAIAGGLVLMLACDWRVAVESGALFGLTEIRAGVPYPASANAVVQAELGPAAARELVLAGKNHGPERALALGIVDELQPANAVLARSQARARELAMAPTEGYGRIKRQLRGQALAQMAEAIAAGDPLHDNWLFAETQAAAARVLREG